MPADFASQRRCRVRIQDLPSKAGRKEEGTDQIRKAEATMTEGDKRDEAKRLARKEKKLAKKEKKRAMKEAKKEAKKQKKKERKNLQAEGVVTVGGGYGQTTATSPTRASEKKLQGTKSPTKDVSKNENQKVKPVKSSQVVDINSAAVTAEKEAGSLKDRVKVWCCENKGPLKLGCKIAGGLLLFLILTTAASTTSQVLEIDSATGALTPSSTWFGADSPEYKGPVKTVPLQSKGGSILGLHEMSLNELSDMVSSIRFSALEQGSWVAHSETVTSVRRSSDETQTTLVFLAGGQLVIDETLAAPLQVTFTEGGATYQVKTDEVFAPASGSASACVACPEDAELEGYNCVCSNGTELSTDSFSCTEVIPGIPGPDSEPPVPLGRDVSAQNTFTMDPVLVENEQGMCIGSTTVAWEGGSLALSGPQEAFQGVSGQPRCASEWTYHDATKGRFTQVTFRGCKPMRNDGWKPVDKYAPKHEPEYIFDPIRNSGWPGSGSDLNTARLIENNVFWCPREDVPDYVRNHTDTDYPADKLWGLCVPCTQSEPVVSPTPQPTNKPSQAPIPKPTRSPLKSDETPYPSAAPSASPSALTVPSASPSAAPTTTPLQCIQKDCQSTPMTVFAAKDFCRQIGQKVCRKHELERVINRHQSIMASHHLLLQNASFQTDKLACFGSNQEAVIWTSDHYNNDSIQCPENAYLALNLAGDAYCASPFSELSVICCQQDKSEEQLAAESTHSGEIAGPAITKNSVTAEDNHSGRLRHQNGRN